MKPWALFQIVVMSLLSTDTVVNAVPLSATANSIVPPIGTPPSLSSRSVLFSPDIELEIRETHGDRKEGLWTTSEAIHVKPLEEALLDVRMREMILNAPHQPGAVLAALKLDLNQIIPKWNLLKDATGEDKKTEIGSTRRMLNTILEACKTVKGIENLDGGSHVVAEEAIKGIEGLWGFKDEKKEGSSVPSGSSG
ncbi:hypothetical protein H0H93_000899 [Arthromyces matolae]|nr:hypothetical protein H0H93_000899 [Arthromyces matolae]